MCIRDSLIIVHALITELRDAEYLRPDVFRGYALGYGPVSYTHLDVYKRQHYNPPSAARSARTTACALSAHSRNSRSGDYRRVPVCRELYADRYTPVSYTHLDVYKRQLFIFSPQSRKSAFRRANNEITEGLPSGGAVSYTHLIQLSRRDCPS